MRPKLISWNELRKYIYYSDVLIVDLREVGDYQDGHISGAWNIPYEHLEDAMPKFDSFDTVIFYCDYGNQSLEAARILAHKGRRAASVVGGYQALVQKDIDG